MVDELGLQKPENISSSIKKTFTGHLIFVNWTYRATAEQFTIEICHSQSSVCLDIIRITNVQPMQRQFTYNQTVEPPLSPGVYNIKISEINAISDVKASSEFANVGKFGSA